MSDIVEWLLQQGEWTGDKTWATEPHCSEAADEITRLHTENEKLREALSAERERCARVAEQARDDTCDGPVAWSMADSIAAAIRGSVGKS